MRIAIEIPSGPGLHATVRAICQILAQCWGSALREHPITPLYSSGVRYQPEPNAGDYEVFKRPEETLHDGWGDCDDLVIYRVAELRAKGENASVQIMRVRGTGRMHVRVRRANGSVEDPSLILQKQGRRQ